MKTFQIRLGTLSLLCAGPLAFSPVGRAATVTQCDEASLRSALAGGGTVTFNCDGTIALSNALSIITDTVLDGTGRSVTVSGADAVQVFRVKGVSFTVIGLTIANGRGEQGGGIVNDGGQVHFQNVTLANHVAFGRNGALGSSGEQGSGGAILNGSGVLTAVSCLFSNNQARGGKGSAGMFLFAACGGPGLGGAIADDHGQIYLTNCQFVSNSAIGGDGGDMQFGFGGCGGPASAGALSSVGGLVTVVNTSFSSNRVAGGNTGAGEFGNGGRGGSAEGGAVTLSDDGRLECTGSFFWRNTSVGGTGGRSQPGGHRPGWRSGLRRWRRQAGGLRVF